MRNLKASEQDPYAFFEKVCGNKNKTKKDPDYHNRLKIIGPKLQPYYADYKTRFDTNQIKLISAAGVAGKDAEDLNKLYRFKDPDLQKLKLELTTTKDNRKIGPCPNCTISEVNSFDHILPRATFMEFIIHPRNLFPSCTICNGHKNTVWLKDGKHVFLNLYLDKLPDEQYLFVSITMDNEIPIANFAVENRAGIDPFLFEVIYSHYTKLELPQRFKDNIDEVITPLEISIKEYKGILPLEEVIKTQLEIARKRKISNGQNYWKSVLEMGLLNSRDFMAKFG